MKTHTIDFKSQLTELGRELRGVITYNNTELEEEIYSITPHYNADDYEMLNYGNYVVYKSEKQEDTNTYKLTCYDKMLYSMKQNEDLGVEYPIKIKDYLVALGNKIGLSVANTTFYNQDMKIPSELYLGQEYTYRDILDEIAQATGSIICLNENDEIVVKYPTKTNDTIDEEFLKDVNVDFGQMYGAINTIVLSRSGESDNVYYPETLPENPIEIKIKDNQIMNFNNRSDYLQGIYNALNGLYYYINDFTSTGILYYDVGDLYNVKIGENTYQCLMLNDEINVTTGIEEIIHTDMPEKSETDYSKADKTDRKINQTYLIVDKQNQEIEAVVKQTVDPTNPESTVNKVSRLNIRVGELESSIKDIADITTYGESDRAEVELKDINKSEPIMIKVHPTSTNISYLYPRENLYPSDLQYLPNRIIRFTRTYEEDGTTKTENIDYELPDDLLRYSSEVYDEFYLDYDSHTCQVIKRCAYNADGRVRALGKEITTDYEYPTIVLGDGNYTITLPGYDFGYLYVRLMAKNIYTTQFYTKVETDSAIEQSAKAIELSVNRKFKDVDGDIKDLSANLELKIDKDDNDQIISMINASADRITLSAGRLVINSGNFKLDENGNVKCTNGEFQGNITLREGNDISIQTDDNMKSMSLDYSGLVFYDSNNNITAEITRSYISNKDGASVYIQGNSYFSIEKYIGNTKYQLMYFDDINGTPFIRNTAVGTLFPDNSLGGVKIENGLITNWNIQSTTCDLNNVTITGIKVSNGLIENITYYSN